MTVGRWQAWLYPLSQKNLCSYAWCPSLQWPYTFKFASYALAISPRHHLSASASTSLSSIMLRGLLLPSLSPLTLMELAMCSFSMDAEGVKEDLCGAPECEAGICWRQFSDDEGMILLEGAQLLILLSRLPLLGKVCGGPLEEGGTASSATW